MFQRLLFPLRCTALAHWIQNCSLLPMLVLAIVIRGQFLRIARIILMSVPAPVPCA